MANVLNVYDSFYGNTKEVALSIGRTLSEKHTVITMEAAGVTDDLIIKADVFIIGSPIHYWRPSQKIAVLLLRLQRNRVRGRIGICYDTRLEKMMAGNAVSKIARVFSSLHFITMLGKGEYFFVETSKGPLKLGEVSKAERFADRILSFIEGAAKDATQAPGFSLHA